MNTKPSLTSALKLYLVTDQQVKNNDLFATVSEAIQGGVSLVQYREKHKPYDLQLEEASKLKELCDRFNVPFIVNDNVVLATEINAEGAHVGQSDLEAGLARLSIGSDKWLGVSVSTVEEALKAEEAGADYLGVGAVFSTSTKLDADAVSLESLEAICKAVSIPVVAIGGIGEQNVQQLVNRGLAGIAVVSAILGSDSPRTSAKTLFEVDL